ncbi:sulfite exporter TauE/SafE family protein [Halococcus sp. AFM35]|uniref:sulfite exporter TauE/SafE family protein n=1 Tax=Halococcus sp. AFM35 TaxID=3421653 RepID=UPI003EC0EDFD
MCVIALGKPFSNLPGYGLSMIFYRMSGSSDTAGGATDSRKAATGRTVDDNTGSTIGALARQIDALAFADRARVSRKTLRNVGFALAVYAIVLIGIVTFVVPRWSGTAVDTTTTFIPTIVIAAFLFETFDSASGMGFGATLGALLFVLGYPAAAVVPTLLFSEAATGLVGGLFHNEFKNVEFGFGDESATEATRILGLVVVIGVAATVVSVVLAYLAIEVSGPLVQAYIGIIIVFIAGLTLFQNIADFSGTYSQRQLIGFAALAGLNKGITGSGFGPVITLGQILSGIYEKSATAITSMSEGVVSLAGIITFLTITVAGVGLDLTLLPSVFAGGFLAAIFAPYTVRVMPNRILQYIVPGYALILAATLFADIL